MSESDAVRQLALRFTDPVQHDDEVIRGIMRADETIAECSRATGIDWAAVGEKARRFVRPYDDASPHAMGPAIRQKRDRTVYPLL